MNYTEINLNSIIVKTEASKLLTRDGVLDWEYILRGIEAELYPVIYYLAENYPTNPPASIRVAPDSDNAVYIEDNGTEIFYEATTVDQDTQPLVDTSRVRRIYKNFDPDPPEKNVYVPMDWSDFQTAGQIIGAVSQVIWISFVWLCQILWFTIKLMWYVGEPLIRITVIIMTLGFVGVPKNKKYIRSKMSPWWVLILVPILMSGNKPKDTSIYVLPSTPVHGKIGHISGREVVASVNQKVVLPASGLYSNR